MPTEQNLECPICFESGAEPLLHGCTHAFCEACISKWLTSTSAHCPICSQPVYGLISAKPDRFFLTPHYGSFGITVKRLFDDAHGVKLTQVEQDSICAAVGLEAGNRVLVNRLEGYQETVDALHEAIRERKMVCMDRIPSSGEDGGKRTAKVEVRMASPRQESWLERWCLRLMRHEGSRL